jgi:succinyl-diaminopimelate desuccinylase
VAVTNPLVQRLRVAGDLSVGPKQAWTPVAEFATIGVDAINFGPGDPQYAHRDDERVEEAALVRSYEVLRRFLGLDGAAPAAGGSE